MSKNKITKTKNSTLKTNIARLLLALVLVVAQATTTTLPALAAETVSTTSTVTVNGVKYTTLLKQGQAQLTVGDKAIILSKENVMAAVIVDQYGTAWTISYSGRCSGYNYELQKNEPTANLHTYVNNAEEFITNGSYSTAVKTTTGTVNLPTLEEFKKLAGITSSNGGNTSTGGNTNTGSNTGNNNANNGSNTGSGTFGNLNLVETKKVGDKQYTFVVTNGVAQVVVDNKVITIPDKNICEMGLDTNGTIIFITNNNGVKEARWFNPTLQTEVKTNLMASNASCLLKDSNALVTGVLVNLYTTTGTLVNSSIFKVLTLDEQKKVLGIATETTVATKVDESRVVKKGDYTYVVYKTNGKQLTKYTFKKDVVTWRGVKYKSIKRVGSIKKSHNMIVTTSKGSVVTIDYDTMARKTIFKASGSLKAKSFTYDSRGFVTGYITTDGIRHSVTTK